MKIKNKVCITAKRVFKYCFSINHSVLKYSMYKDSKYIWVGRGGGYFLHKSIRRGGLKIFWTSKKKTISGVEKLTLSKGLPLVDVGQNF